jgi:hypothetical protein
MKRVRVVKLGGSLLTMPNLKQKFQKWLRENPHPLTLIIVGGGPVVDAVRQVHLANPLSEEFAHWVCIDLLQHTARIAYQVLGNVDLMETMDDLQQSLSDSNVNSSTPIIAVVQVATCFNREGGQSINTESKVPSPTSRCWRSTAPWESHPLANRSTS